jgi:hypothetical protein
MKKSVQGVFQTPQNKSDNTRLSHPLIKFPAPKRSNIRSTKNKNLHPIIDHVKSLLIQGQTVNELDVRSLCGRFSSDSVKVLKRVHQCYGDYTTLTVDGGLWTLMPRQEASA